MVTVPSGMSYRVDVISCILWLCEKKWVGKDSSSILKEGPKNKKSKWYHADKKWSSYQVDIDIFFCPFLLGLYVVKS